MYHTREEQEVHIQLWQESGMKKTEYAKEAGIKPATFYHWCRMHQEAKHRSTSFVEVSLAADESSVSSQPLILKIGTHYRIEILNEFSVAPLKKLLMLLEELSC